ncbi:MAG TPA: hypothetical protein VI583_06830 [Cyclobacteriaceae bacterium]|nr:hypothetical protein [Cyclobacteriaceae bacterium]
MNSQAHKIIFISASLALLLLFRFPLWKISLGIPQYPKDITVHIWIDKMVNHTKKAMEIINVLNHNIGMKAIEPHSIPELKYFRWIVYGMVLIGIIAGMSGNRKVMISWLGVLVLLCVAGLADFYAWQYHYGHDLDPAAPIAVEGKSFQPPLIGKKTIVNFTVISLPMAGAVVPAVSFILGVIAIRLTIKR